MNANAGYKGLLNNGGQKNMEKNLKIETIRFEHKLQRLPWHPPWNQIHLTDWEAPTLFSEFLAHPQN